MKLLGLIPSWIATSFPIIRYVLVGIVALSAIALIVVTIMQDTKEGGNNVITGVQESYYSQNKVKTREGILKKLTIAFASIIGIAILLFFITIVVQNAF